MNAVVVVEPLMPTLHTLALTRSPKDSCVTRWNGNNSDSAYISQDSKYIWSPIMWICQAQTKPINLSLSVSTQGVCWIVSMQYFCSSFLCYSFQWSRARAIRIRPTVLMLRLWDMPIPRAVHWWRSRTALYKLMKSPAFRGRPQHWQQGPPDLDLPCLFTAEVSQRHMKLVGPAHFYESLRSKSRFGGFRRPQFSPPLMFYETRTLSPEMRKDAGECFDQVRHGSD